MSPVDEQPQLRPVTTPIRQNSDAERLPVEETANTRARNENPAPNSIDVAEVFSIDEWMGTPELVAELVTGQAAAL